MTYSIGSYHGVHGWQNALYCRNCGRSVFLAQSAEQFLKGFGKESEPQGSAYELFGAVQPKHIVCEACSAVPEVECACGAKGPLGNAGPLTDDDHGETCPACKQPTLEAGSEWIT